MKLAFLCCAYLSIADVTRSFSPCRIPPTRQQPAVGFTRRRTTVRLNESAEDEADSKVENKQKTLVDEQETNVNQPDATSTEEEDTADEEESEWSSLSWAWLLPWCTAVGGFLTYDITSQSFALFMDQNRKWYQVDGGTFQTSMITPALNGPIQTSISILFGTLVAMTVSNLYQRQLKLHSSLMNVVESIRYIRLLLEAFPDHIRCDAQRLLYRYSQRLTHDISRHTMDATTVRKINLSYFVRFIARHEDDLSPRLLDEVYININRINVERASLLSNGQSTFPLVHYVNLITLATYISIIFLVETNQDALKFIANLELRVCWGLLLGTFSMLGLVLRDLSNPFSGTFGLVDVKDVELAQPFHMEHDEEEECELF